MAAVVAVAMAVALAVAVAVALRVGRRVVTAVVAVPRRVGRRVVAVVVAVAARVVPVVAVAARVVAVVVAAAGRMLLRGLERCRRAVNVAVAMGGLGEHSSKQTRGAGHRGPPRVGAGALALGAAHFGPLAAVRRDARRPKK